MWGLAKKIINLSGDKAGNIKASIASSFFYAVFTALPYMAIYYFFVDVMANNLTGKTIAIVSGLLLASLLGGVIMKIITYRLQAWSGNYAAAKQRLDIGDRLKRVPMGFFNEKSLGEITTVLTSDISYFENQAIVLLDSIINGTLNIAISSVFLMIFDWRFGLIFLACFAIAVVIIGIVQRKSEKIVPLRKKAETNAISATLEFIRGISVFKLFHMGGRSMDNIKGSYREYSEKSSELESKLMTWDVISQS